MSTFLYRVPHGAGKTAKTKFSIIAIEEEGQQLVLSKSATSKKWLQWTEVSGQYSYVLFCSES
jgi:hypothetical protein